MARYQSARAPTNFECGAFNHSATSPWPQKAQTPPSVGGYVSNARRLNKNGLSPPTQRVIVALDRADTAEELRDCCSIRPSKEIRMLSNGEMLPPRGLAAHRHLDHLGTVVESGNEMPKRKGIRDPHVHMKLVVHGHWASVISCGRSTTWTAALQVRLQ
jgi:hypothetical protein